MHRKRTAKRPKVAKHHLIPIMSRAHIAWHGCGEMALDVWCGHAAAYPGCEHCAIYRAVADKVWLSARKKSWRAAFRARAARGGRRGARA